MRSGTVHPSETGKPFIFNAEHSPAPQNTGNTDAIMLCMLNALTVDVEDYFHTEAMTPYVKRDQWATMDSRVEHNTDALLQIFDDSGIRATFYFLGWVAERFPALVRRTKDAGHEIGCHSHLHRPVFRLSPDEFREDTLRSKRTLEEACGTAVIGYRAPSFSIVKSCPWAFEILEELGFKYDSSVNPVHHPLYGNPQAPRHPYHVGKSLLEIPIATWRVGQKNLPVGGGAYLRILPYKFMQSGLRHMNLKENTPAMIYLHPWEIDADQPRLCSGTTAALRQYTGLARMEHKLRRLISEFTLGPAREAFAPWLTPAAMRQSATV